MAINSTASKGLPKSGKSLIVYEKEQMKVGGAVKKNPVPSDVSKVKGGK